MKSALIYRAVLNYLPLFPTRGPVNKLCTSIRCRKTKTSYDVRSSLKEPGRKAATKIDAGNPEDNPRRLGKGRVRLVDPAPLNQIERFGEAVFTSSSGTFARASNAKNGTRRRGAIRNRSRPSQVVRAGFEPG